MSQRLESLESSIAKQWGGLNVDHIQGHRYRYLHSSTLTLKTSPPLKVGTLAKVQTVVMEKKTIHIGGDFYFHFLRNALPIFKKINDAMIELRLLKHVEKFR